MRIAAIARGSEFRPKSTNELFADPACPLCKETMAETVTVIVRTKPNGAKQEIHAGCLPSEENPVSS